MSYQGEREDAHEVEVDHGEVEQQGADGTGADEGDADGLGEEPGEGDVDPEQDDDAGTDEGQAGGAPEVAVKPRSAATIAVQEAKRAAKEARAEAEALRRERDEALRERQGRQTEAEQRLEQERVALMSPEEKTEYLLNRQQQGFNARFAALEYRQWDSADRTAFDSLCARNPAFDAVRGDVESQAEQLRKAGQAVPSRETLATYFIGKRAIERASKGGKTRQAAKGRENISRNQGKPVASGGGVPSRQERSGGNEAAQRAARLSSMEI